MDTHNQTDMHSRADIIGQVFNIKVHEYIQFLKKNKTFGDVEACMFNIISSDVICTLSVFLYVCAVSICFLYTNSVCIGIFYIIFILLYSAFRTVCILFTFFSVLLDYICLHIPGSFMQFFI